MQLLRIATQLEDVLPTNIYFEVVNSSREHASEALRIDRLEKEHTLATWLWCLSFLWQARKVKILQYKRALLEKCKENAVKTFRSKVKMQETGNSIYDLSPIYLASCCYMLGDQEYIYWIDKCIADSTSVQLEDLVDLHPLSHCDWYKKLVQENSRIMNVLGPFLLKSVYRLDSKTEILRSMYKSRTLTNSSLEKSIYTEVSPFSEQQRSDKENKWMLETKQRMRERLALYSMRERKEVPQDGNCQMNSLSDQLYGTFEYAGYIRGQIVAWLRKNAEMELENGAKLLDFCADPTGWESYCNSMEKSGTWGDHLTLVAAAEVFSAVIVIISSSKDSCECLHIISPQKKPKKLIQLCHYEEFHYGTIEICP
ncbi:OTU domain-containing protein DDB_G0284757-like [Schistocerca gregaria]|uniref:OTU domain-containing protein DDB_G0284757-like n=1 Tax=Schistocerca gregaria TaxID=7010 RepID=UPI00211DBB64|nr:OTU domain-containing protein DDB_G0284757-like [Schistocerca gregaria]